MELPFGLCKYHYKIKCNFTDAKTEIEQYKRDFVGINFLTDAAIKNVEI